MSVMTATPADPIRAAAALAPTPTQRRGASRLFELGGVRRRFDPDIGGDLRSVLEAGLGPLVADRQPGQSLQIAKRTLAQIHTCGGWLVAERGSPFTWSAASARGTVAHKAVELSLTLHGNPAPLDLVDLAVERLIDSTDRGLRTWLLDAPAGEMAELRGAAADWLVKFQDTFPLLRRSWRPRLESCLTVDLCGNRVTLRGKVDLALGRADGSTARVMIIDFKGGRAQPVHADDLRFYALLETIRVGVPPFRLATFSLDSGTWVAEDVDEEVLLVAARRTIDAAAKLVALEGGRPPVLRASTACRWCPAAADCPAARPTPASGEDDGTTDGTTDGTSDGPAARNLQQASR